MSTTEHNVLQIFQDKDGNKYIVYPITKAELVDGLQELLDGRVPEGHGEDKNNPHNVTLEQVGGAAASHQHAAGDITDGILPVERGGTGVATIAELLTALGLGEPVKIVTGSYTGNNTYKAANACTINFDFTPKIVIVAETTQGRCYGPLVMLNGSKYSVASASGTTNALVTITWSENSVSWYGSESGAAQMNYTGNYVYVAIG